MVERWSLAGELSLSCARPAADGGHPVFFIFYSCSSVYFTFSIIAVPLL